MLDEYILRVNLPQALSSTVACIVLKPCPAALSDANSDAGADSRQEMIVSSIKELRRLLHDPVIVGGVHESETKTSLIRIICPKTAAVKLFKAIAAVKAKIKVMLDKKAVQLQLEHSELQAAVMNVLLTSLTAAGWTALSTTTLISANSMLPSFARHIGLHVEVQRTKLDCC